MPDNSEVLLRAVLSLIGRQTFPADLLSEIVLSKGAGEKQRRAFNMCDGTKGQGEIAKVLKLDTGNFSRTVSRWVDAGIVFRLAVERATIQSRPTKASAAVSPFRIMIARRGSTRLLAPSPALKSAH